MSRVGKAPVKIAKGVKVVVANGQIKVEGPKGKLSAKLPEGVKVTIGPEEIKVEIASKTKELSAMHGTVRALIQNMVHGCHEEFVKELDINGVGYRAAVKGKQLSMTLGYSHPVDFDLPDGVTAKVDKNTHIVLSCADRVLLGRTAAQIRALRPPEPYQGKGVKYTDEHIQRKQGKAAGAAAK